MCCYNKFYVKKYATKLVVLRRITPSYVFNMLWFLVARGNGLLPLALEFLYIVAYAVQFLGYGDALWAVWCTLAAAYAVVGLTQARHAAVISHEECTTLLGVGR